MRNIMKLDYEDILIKRENEIAISMEKENKPTEDFDWYNPFSSVVNLFKDTYKSTESSTKEVSLDDKYNDEYILEVLNDIL